MTTEESNRISRRRFGRAVTLRAGALLLCDALPAWAAKKNKQPEASASSQIGSLKTKCETKVLWDFDGCLEDRFMDRVTVYVYNGHAYTWVLLPGYKTMIVKVPLEGGAAQMFPLMPGHVTGADPHRYYSIAADAQGYIHVAGDMHSSPLVKHWISKRPEDISEFVPTSNLAANKRPQGLNVTYPHFFRSPDGVLYHSIRCADPVWGIGISVLDVKTQTWTMLGADVPASELHGKRGGKKTNGKPITAWEDNGEGGDFGYTQPHAAIRWDKKKRMHLAFTLLNENTTGPSNVRFASEGIHTATDVLYAWSDDGGKSFHRGDGSAIRLPMRAEAGPHQADVVYSRHDGPPPWVSVMPGLSIDEKNRPVVNVRDFKTGRHHMVLENGKWTEMVKGAGSPGNEQAAKSNEEEDEGIGEAVNISHLALPYEPHHPDGEYLRETGSLVYTTFPDRDRFHGNKPKWHRIMLVLSKPAKANGV